MKSGALFQYTRTSPYLRYIIAFALVAVATIIKLTLLAPIGSSTPYLLYFAVVLFVARYYGNAAALCSGFLAALAITYFFIPPLLSFRISSNNLLQVIAFFCECVFIAWLSNHLERATRQIVENQKRFQILIEKSSVGIMMVQLDGRIIYSSPSVTDITGYNNMDLESSDIWSFLMSEEITDVKEKFYSIASCPGRTVKVLHRVRHRKGSIIWVESAITNLIEEPLVNSVIINFSDVTERVIRDQQMEDFIGIASHELKTPLTSLKAYTQVLEMRMKKENNATSTILVNKIDKQINRVVAMIFDLLDVTKLQSGIMHLNKERFELNEMICDVVESIQNTTDSHQIITDLAPAVLIDADKNRINQVITNLLSNAIKYSPDADTVNLSTKIEGNFIVVYVKDRGIGISKSEIDKIFDRFYRVDRIRESYQGLGLGLYISYQIIAGHGGKMGVYSEESNGSTFWFSLPL